MHYGYKLGSISEQRWQDYQRRRAQVEQLKEQLKTCRLTPKSPIQDALEAVGYAALTDGVSAEELVRRPHITVAMLKPALDFEFDAAAAAQTEIELKYEGYINKARKEAEKMMAMDHVVLPEDLDYDQYSIFRWKAARSSRRSSRTLWARLPASPACRRPTLRCSRWFWNNVTERNRKYEL